MQAPGVGTVTKPGLPLPVGEPAINPVPRAMMIENIGEVARLYACAADADIEISIPGGEALAQKTLNPRLGIIGGLSILGTTGIVVPYSCAAWIAFDSSRRRCRARARHRAYRRRDGLDVRKGRAAAA